MEIEYLTDINYNSFLYLSFLFLFSANKHNIKTDRETIHKSVYRSKREKKTENLYLCNKLLWKLDILTLKLSVNWWVKKRKKILCKKLWLLEVKYTHNNYSVYDKHKFTRSFKANPNHKQKTWKLKSSLPLIAFHYFCKIIIKFFFLSVLVPDVVPRQKQSQ